MKLKHIYAALAILILFFIGCRKNDTVPCSDQYLREFILKKQIQLGSPYRGINGVYETHYVGDYMIFSVSPDQNDAQYEWYFDLNYVSTNAAVAVSTEQAGQHPLKLIITNTCGE